MSTCLTIHATVYGATREELDEEVRKLTGQDPMGELSRMVRVRVRGVFFEAAVSGYSTSGLEARLTFHADSIDERHKEVA